MRSECENEGRTHVLEAGRPDDVALAARLLREGRIVAFPTETVYGLGVRGDYPAAVERLYELKGRPREKRFVLLIASAEEMERHAAPGALAGRLARAFWPGPLTLVLPDGRGGTVGLRCTDHEAARELVRLAGAPVAAPSANMSGEPPALSAEEVLRAFAGRIAAVLDGGPARIGEPSSVVRIIGNELEVLRHGAIGEAALRAAAGEAGEEGEAG